MIVSLYERTHVGILNDNIHLLWNKKLFTTLKLFSTLGLQFDKDSYAILLKKNSQTMLDNEHRTCNARS